MEKMKNIYHSGFTLVEVVVAMAILAVLSLLTSQALKSAVDNKIFIGVEVNRDSQLADTLHIIRTDIAQAFHYRDIPYELELLAQSTGTPQAATPPPIGAPPLAPPPLTPQQAPQAGAATPRPSATPTTGFIGDAESVYFTTLSNVRTLRDSQESDQAKVGYFVKACKTGPKSLPTKCLYRTLAPILDEDIDKPGPETLLLENVEEFKLRYLGPEREDFVTTWKTGKNGDDISKDKFPYAVEITLTIHDKSNPKDHEETVTVLAPIHFENNPKKKTDPATKKAPGT